MNTDQIRKLLKNLQLSMRCPSCNHKYELNEIFLRGYVDTNYFLQLNCNQCHTPVFATIALSGNLKEAAQKIEQTGENIKAVEKMHNHKPIKADDIIEMHNFLNKFDGDFRKFFKI